MSVFDPVLGFAPDLGEIEISEVMDFLRGELVEINAHRGAAWWEERQGKALEQFGGLERLSTLPWCKPCGSGHARIVSLTSDPKEVWSAPHHMAGFHYFAPKLTRFLLPCMDQRFLARLQAWKKELEVVTAPTTEPGGDRIMIQVGEQVATLNVPEDLSSELLNDTLCIDSEGRVCDDYLDIMNAVFPVRVYEKRKPVRRRETRLDPWREAATAIGGNLRCPNCGIPVPTEWVHGGGGKWLCQKKG